jgi:hypothetical protein
MQNISLKLLACILVCIWAFAARAGAQNVVVKQFESGAGSNAVGVADASEDTEIDGPQALTSGDDGELFLLDQNNGRILRFNPRQPTATPRVLGLPDDVQPTDLVVRKSDIFVWDGSVRALKASGDDDASYRGLEEVSTRGADDPFVLSAFSQMGTQPPGSDIELLNPETRAVASRQPRARARQYIASRGHGAVIVDVIPDSRNTSAHIEVSAQGETSPFAKLSIDVANRLGAVEFLEIDNHGRMYVLGEDIPPQADRAVSFVARYSESGLLEGIYELPLGADVPLTRRFVTVSGDGDVYFLRTQRTGVEVIGVGFRALGRSKVIAVRPPPRSPAQRFADHNGPVTAARPLDRQKVIENAFAFEGIQWKLTPAAYGQDPDTSCTGFHRIRRPGYLQGRVGQEVRGIPYCWGCFGSLGQIRAKFERGVLAGNVCTHNAPRSDVAGVDCSAFVSAAWGLSTHYTTDAIPSIANPIANPWDLRPGDALDKPRSHVMLFLRFTPDRKVEVMESSTGGCNGRVCRNVYPLASLLARGYRPMRYRALANDTTVVAQSTEATEATENPQAHAKATKKRHH